MTGAETPILIFLEEHIKWKVKMNNNLPFKAIPLSSWQFYHAAQKTLGTQFLIRLLFADV